MAAFLRVSHFGLVVRDLDKTATYLKRLGAEEKGPAGTGSRGDVKMKVQSLKLGGIEIELFEHIEGRSMISEFLDTHGEGVHHVSYFVDDLDGVLKLTGSKPVYGPVETPDGLRIAFIDAGLPGGMLLEIEQQLPVKRTVD